MSYEPTIKINGVTLPGSWDGSALVALDQASIHWGREDLFDETGPTTMTVGVIDPDGNWATDNTLIGQPITMDRATPATPMFIGRIADVDMVPLTVLSPVSNRYQQVWRVDLICTDKLTDLDQSIVGGPGAPGGGVAIGIWPARSTPAARIADMFTQGAGDLVSSIATPVPVAVAGQTPWVKSHPATENVSLLSLIEKLYKYIPLGRVNYNPSTNGVEIGLPASNAGIALVLSGGLMKLAPVSASIIPAGQIIVTEDLTVSSNVGTAIDAVQLGWRTFGSPDTDVIAQAFTTRVNTSSLGRRILSVDSDIYNIEQHALNVVAATAALVNLVNGRFSVPKGLRVDLRRWAFAAGLITILLDPKTRTDALYFPGSVLNKLNNVGPMFQLIGGTITWHNSKAGSRLPAGWVIDMQLAPTTDATVNVSMSALVTNATPTMADFDPAITMAELGNVTIGLA